MNKKLQLKNLCPCGTNLDYKNCCGQWHDNQSNHYLKAPSAEQLMRSRYSAFVLKLEQYLLDTWHANTRPQSLDFTNDNTKWLGLTIINKAQQNDTNATVEFIAKNKVGGKSCNIHENSSFVLEGGIWLYVEGKHE
jgi:SEC-C motif-containing protein